MVWQDFNPSKICITLFFYHSPRVLSFTCEIFGGKKIALPFRKDQDEF